MVIIAYFKIIYKSKKTTHGLFFPLNQQGSSLSYSKVHTSWLYDERISFLRSKWLWLEYFAWKASINSTKLLWSFFICTNKGSFSSQKAILQFFKSGQIWKWNHQCTSSYVIPNWKSCGVTKVKLMPSKVSYFTLHATSIQKYARENGFLPFNGVAKMRWIFNKNPHRSL